MFSRKEGTIVAAATAAARGGVAIVRISGPDSLHIIRKLTARNHFSPRYAEFCTLNTGNVSCAGDSVEDKTSCAGVGGAGREAGESESRAGRGCAGREAGESESRAGGGRAGREAGESESRAGVGGASAGAGGVRDEGIVLFFRAPASYTGEDVAEIHCHGNPIIVAEIIRFALDNGARLAEPGEFTLRAFLNGKTDLSKAEAIHDIISARTPLQLSSAERQFSGELADKVVNLQSRIYDIIAELNAAIDYPEEDLEVQSVSEAAARARIICAELSALAATYKRGRLIREGVKVAIIGEPNVGKSSLLNALVGRDRAIVSDIAGTTRDTIEDKYEYNGIEFVITDTAGLRETVETIEELGIERAKAAASESDVILLVTAPNCGSPTLNLNTPTIHIRNKCDLKEAYNKEEETSVRVIEASALTGENIERVRREVFEVACGAMCDGGFVLTNLRHYEAVAAAAEYMGAAGRAGGEVSPEILTIELLDAANSLGEITGIIGSDSIISAIFSKFCVGK